MPIHPYTVLPPLGTDQDDEWVKLGFAAQMAASVASDKKVMDGKLGEAQSYYMQALRLNPRNAVATMNLGVVFAQAGHINEALIAGERAHIYDGEAPTSSIIAMNRAIMAFDAERVDEAYEQAKRAAELAKKDAAGNAERLVLAMIASAAGYPQQSVDMYNQVLDVQPDNLQAAANACFAQTLTDCGPKELLRQRKRWHDAASYKGVKQTHYNDRNPARPIRVGYVGGDFKNHSASALFARVLLHHTPTIEMFLYSSLPVDPNTDARTKAFQAACGNRWRDITAMDDEEADKLIRKDRIDVLVDLAAHTAGSRLALFTRKPAPVQVTAWGFAHGTGCPEIDYFLADPVAVKAEERQHYAERIFDLPCIITYEPPDEYNLKGTSMPPIKRNGYFTFGAYSRYEKMGDAFLKACADILRQVPDSKMEFKDSGFKRPYSIRRVQDLMNYPCPKCHGVESESTFDHGECEECKGEGKISIDPTRLLFSMASSQQEHMGTYQQSDLILNLFPHSGGCVVMEQLYMGVPMITLDGTQAGGRSGSSVLTAMGRTEWVAKTVDEYVAKAVEWSERTKELAEARKTLRKELLDSPCIKGYVEAVEAAYATMYKEWCER